MKSNIKHLLADAVIACAPVLSMALPGIASATTVTWTGAGTDNK